MKTLASELPRRTWFPLVALSLALSVPALAACDEDGPSGSPGSATAPLMTGPGAIPGFACVGWTCPAAFYGAADGCDCDCGCWDPDCDDPEQHVFGCSAGATCEAPGECAASILPEACDGWTCSALYFGSGDGCDCDCGCWDPDCDDPAQPVFGCGGGGSCVAVGTCEYPDDPELCEGWRCSPGYFGTGDGCDCGCGCWDPDCDDAEQHVFGCDWGGTCAAPGTCDYAGVPEPCAGWTCSRRFYGTQDGCDCGCGCWDPDCDDDTQPVFGCDWAGACVVPGECDYTDRPELCGGWSCAPAFFGTHDGCDCGCGCWDPDCDDPTQFVFGCGGGGACMAPGVCDPDRALTPPGPPAEGWTCPAPFYDTLDGCDCNCGAWDPDCDEPSQSVFGCGNGACVPPGVCDPSSVPPPPEPPVEGWTCPAPFYDTLDGCDCNCGAWDPDCDDPGQGVFGCAPGQSCAPPGICR